MVLLKEFGTLYDFLIDLLKEKIDISKASKEQSAMIKKVAELEKFVLSEEEIINNEKTIDVIKKAKRKTQKGDIILAQKRILNNATKLHNERNVTIDAFINKNIYSRDLIEDVCQEEKPKYKGSKSERLKIRKQNQEGQGLKILTPEQMLSRLLISLAQLKAGNNSQKLKNEIRQLLYSFYR